MEAAFDVNKFKVGVWGLALGGRVFPCPPGVRTQQEAELKALVRGVRLCIRVGWSVWRLIRDNSSALEQVASLRASAGLRRQNRHLRKLFYLLQRLEGLVYLEFVPGDPRTRRKVVPGWTRSGGGRCRMPVRGLQTATWLDNRSLGSPTQSRSWVSLKDVGEQPVTWMQWH